ncbi:hypothetical protein QJS04_geneDACA008484 [Acorus gramineus]|uniref:Uncharacterized protein n=1 Tax=Acorus gramineus TaxID=55184 RepID=A0AAV9AGI1_ACOGR|nr:hypothetical protein QJS04_geneDACA008484 [Acorus gramineus]
MIKNRESAARSRARKQVSINFWFIFFFKKTVYKLSLHISCLLCCIWLLFGLGLSTVRSGWIRTRPISLLSSSGRIHIESRVGSTH